MNNLVTGIDHTIIGVRDLEAARDTYVRLGFTPTPRGSHIGWGTANYCIMFPNDYVELLGIVDPAQFTNKLDDFLASREGLLGLAIGTTDADALAVWLNENDIPAEGPKDLKRNLELPEGTVQPAFKLLYPDAGAVPGLSVFACQHLSPALMRRPEWLKHPNTASALGYVAVIVDDPGACQPAYEALFGKKAVTAEEQWIRVATGNGDIYFTRPGGLSSLCPSASSDPDIALPYPAAMGVVVENIARAGDHLDQHGITFRRAQPGRLVVAPEDAGGLWLELTSARA